MSVNKWDNVHNKANHNRFVLLELKRLNVVMQVSPESAFQFLRNLNFKEIKRKEKNL